MQGSNRQDSVGIVQADVAVVDRAAALLRTGQLVAVPTETVYGLAGDASNADAVAAIYTAKGRPDFNPLIVHVSDRFAGERLARFDDLAGKLAQAFWPGPLTLVLPLVENAPVAKAVTAGLPTIALRSPLHPVMRAVIEASGLFLAAPSANRSGSISPTRAEHVASGLGDRVPMILDGGPCEAGLESTIVAVRENGWQILRPGPIAVEQLEAVAGSPPLPVVDAKIEAPGQLASHYAPSKPVRLEAVDAADDEWHIGYGSIDGDDNLSPHHDLAQAASRLFDALHRADASDRAAIAIAPIPHAGIGAAINDRLARAAVR